MSDLYLNPEGYNYFDSYPALRVHGWDYSLRDDPPDATGQYKCHTDIDALDPYENGIMFIDEYAQWTSHQLEEYRLECYKLVSKYKINVFVSSLLIYTPIFKRRWPVK